MVSYQSFVSGLTKLKVIAMMMAWRLLSVSTAISRSTITKRPCLCISLFKGSDWRASKQLAYSNTTICKATSSPSFPTFCADQTVPRALSDAGFQQIPCAIVRSRVSIRASSSIVSLTSTMVNGPMIWNWWVGREVSKLSWLCKIGVMREVDQKEIEYVHIVVQEIQGIEPD